MFKFGPYARPQGPYTRYEEPRTYTSKHTTAVVGGRQQVRANHGFNFSGGGSSGMGSGMGGGTGIGGGDYGGSNIPSAGGGSQGGYNVDRYNPVFDQLEEGTILEDWLPRDGAGLDLLFRRIYLRDPTIGPGIDIIRNMPWSDYQLTGVKDPAIRKIYEDSMNSLDIPLLMPDITGEYLVIGRQTLSMIFNERKGIFSGVVPHDPDFVRVSPLPVYNVDPLCDFKLSPGFRKFLVSSDPRAAEARQALPPDFIRAAQSDQGFLPLDPVSTIYLGRTVNGTDKIGTSALTRVLYFWAIEKALLNAQLASTRRRSRSFIHLMAGIDNIWEPRADELDALAGMLMQANEDPTGGVVATRTGVTINEPVSGGQDFYKWSDELELFAKYKMQAIGISESLLAGDSTYNNAEQARSVFVENLAIMRNRIVNKVFYKKLFPTLARLHGFQKRTKAEINHNIRINSSTKLPVWANVRNEYGDRLTLRRAMQIPESELIMPRINWEKQLKPNQDEKYLEILGTLKNNDYPVTLKQWAMAAGIDPKGIEADSKEDAQLRAKIAKTTESIEIRDEDFKSGGDEEIVDDSFVDTPDDAPAADEAPVETAPADAPEGTEDLASDIIIPDAAAPVEEVQQALLSMMEKKAKGGPQTKGIY
jgi:hypothetical protein